MYIISVCCDGWMEKCWKKIMGKAVKHLFERFIGVKFVKESFQVFFSNERTNYFLDFIRSNGVIYDLFEIPK